MNGRRTQIHTMCFEVPPTLYYLSLLLISPHLLYPPEQYLPNLFDQLNSLTPTRAPPSACILRVSSTESTHSGRPVYHIAIMWAKRGGYRQPPPSSRWEMRKVTKLFLVLIKIDLCNCQLIACNLSIPVNVLGHSPTTHPGHHKTMFID